MTDLGFLDEAVRELGQAVDLQREPISKVSGLSSFQTENLTLEAREITKNGSGDQDPLKVLRSLEKMEIMETVPGPPSRGCFRT
jgi:hypothetical protein